VIVDCAMVLCAGLGTRLRPLTDELPKPLMPVGDTSLLERIIARLRAAGIERVVVNSHHLSDAIARAATDLGLTRSHEPDLLGTAGGVRHAATAIGDGAVLVVNGDIAAEMDIAELCREHHEADALATLAVADLGPPGSGTVGIGWRGEVVRLRGEQFGAEARGAQFIGAQILSALARERLPREGCLVGDVYLPALHSGQLLRCAQVVDRWWDIGTPGAYLRCNLDWLKQRAARCWSDGWISGGVTLDQALVGRGASIAGRGSVERVVVWPGARARAPLQNAIVTPQRIVPVADLH
jgi:mannose-1-phosphate guanylyltransferase